MSRHRASSMINIYGLNYCADHANGNIYEYSLDIYSDNGDPIIKERATAAIHGGLFGVPGKKLFFDEVEFIIVAGATPVEGTGLGPQPIDTTPFVPPTTCNEVWNIGTLVPDLHVAGVVGDVWNEDVIEGVGVIDDNRVDTIYTTWDDGNYKAYGGSDMAQVFYPECQWYDYSGPILSNQFAASTCEFTDGGWIKSGGILTVTDTHGIQASQANYSSTATDSDIAQIGGIYKTSTSGSVNNTSDYPLVYVGVFYKDATATNYTRIYLQRSWTGNERPVITLFSQADGSIRILPSTTGANPAAQVRDCDDWWEVYLQVDNHPGGSLTGTNLRHQVVINPAWNEDGTDSSDVTAIGSLRMGESRAYTDKQIWEVYAGGLDPQVGSEPSSYIDISDIFIDATNHSDTQGGYYIEWRPMYADTDITRDVEILSLNGSAGMLYYDWNTKMLTASDGTNTATVAMTFVQDEKYRLGLVFGSSTMRVGVDLVWGTPVSYDGSFPSTGEFKILRNPEAVNYWRELRGFQIPNIDAYNEINILMLGDGTPAGGNYPPPTPTPTPVELVAPFWSNTGDYIDLTALTNTTFAAMFGASIEGADFNNVYAVNKAALVNTSDSGNRLQIQDSIDCTNAYMAVTDASGNILDSMIYSNAPNGNSVLVPTGANYYVVVTSDTGNAQIRKWDSDTVITTGSVAWEDFFGVPFSLTGSFDKTKIIPLSGISLRFTVPVTSAAYGISFSTKENTALSSSRTGSVNQTVGDYTSSPSVTWGTGVNITGGVNFAGQDISLNPGDTYFFNVRNNDPSTSANYCRIVVFASAQ